MRISELQNLLEITLEKHGDLEVGIHVYRPFFGLVIEPLNKLEIRRSSKSESIAIDEDLDKLNEPQLVFRNIVENGEEEV